MPDNCDAPVEQANVAGAPATPEWRDAIALQLPGLASDDHQRVERYVGRASAAATLRAYRSDWRLFTTWCGENGYRALPAAPATVAAFLTLLAETGYTPRPRARGARAGPRHHRPAPHRHRLAHRAAGAEPPTSQPDAARLDRAMRAIRRDKRGDPPGKKRPADGDVLRDMLRAVTGTSLRAHRDRAAARHRHGGRVPPFPNWLPSPSRASARRLAGC